MKGLIKEMGFSWHLRALLALWSAATASCAVASAELLPTDSQITAKAPPTIKAPPLSKRIAVAVGPEGALSTWRVLKTSFRPLPEDQIGSLRTFCEEQKNPCKGMPRFLAQPGEVIDLEDRIPGQPGAVYVGGRIHAKTKTALSLLVGFRGEAAVFVDGQKVASSTARSFFRDHLLAFLELDPGDHDLLVGLYAPEKGGWKAQFRFLSGGGLPGLGKGVTLDMGAPAPKVAADLAKRAARFSDMRKLVGTTPTQLGRFDFPSGGLGWDVSVELDGQQKTLNPAGKARSFEASQTLPEKGPPQPLKARLAGRNLPTGTLLSSDVSVLLAQRLLEGVTAQAPAASKAPLAWRARELARISRDRDPDTWWRRALVREAKRLVTRVQKGEDPFGDPHGYQRMGFFSKLDDTAQPYELFVPPAYKASGTRSWPLVVTLHGLTGNSGDYFRNTFGLPRNYETGETLLAHGRHGEAPKRGPMFVIAPTGRGRAMYRHAGEMDILEAMADVQKRFRIDPQRIHITGGSMGGTGAAYLPYRHPDLFASAAALAGYHDQRIRQDTNHQGLSHVERFLQAARSDIDWAENGLYLHTLLVRGTKDRPLAWTRSLAKRLKTLGYSHEHREPELGHNVWTETYAGGAIFRYFRPRKRPAHPRHVRLRTARERTRSAYWVTIDERAREDRFAEVEAVADDQGLVTVTTEQTRALTLDPGPAVVSEGPLRVKIDGQGIQGPRPLSLHKQGKSWQVVTRGSYPQKGHKREGVSGPIRDVYHDPLIFVVGTQDPRHTFINRRVARSWARPPYWTVDYPIVDDVDMTEQMIRTHSLVLIGPPGSNSLLARWAARMPITFGNGAIHVGARTYQGEQVGAVFVAPSPAAPDRSVLVIAGPSPFGTWRSIFLPDILPDYVVFDENIALARGRWSIGGTGATALEAGLFGMDWSVPAKAPSPSPAPSYR